MNRKEIPQPDSIQELAQFWDTHDLTDFEDELEEVQEPVFNAQVTVSLTTEEVRIVKDKDYPTRPFEGRSCTTGIT